MKLPRRKFLRLAAGAIALLRRAAAALDYPTRPVRIIVGFPPGFAADILARLLGQRLSERLGQPFVVDNRPGAGTNIATEAVVRAPPDGYTLLSFVTSSALNHILYENLTFNFVRDIAPVAKMGDGPFILVATPSLPAKTVPEFIAYARANPGKINMASPGSGTSPHLCGELFNDRYQHGPRPVSRQLFDGFAERAGAGRLRHDHHVDRVHPGRQAAPLGGHDGQTLGGAARRADGE
jgi:tripartite-type tricarboxylate transporter receptor subunit TctC